MSSLNQVSLIGHLGRDPETRSFSNGGSVTNLRVATSETWKDKTSGERKEATEWHSVAIFGPLADVAARFLRKGSKVFLQGTLKTRKWQKDGTDHYSTEVVLQGFGAQMVMLDGKGGGGDSAPRSTPSESRPAAKQADLDDEIPF